MLELHCILCGLLQGHSQLLIFSIERQKLSLHITPTLHVSCIKLGHHSAYLLLFHLQLMVPEVPQSSFHFLASEDILRGMQLELLSDLMQFFLQGIDGALAGV